jgi:hypothetical protein
MEHAVFYPGPDGAPAFRRFASLEEAVGLVEHLRNVEGVEDVSVQMLTPVPLAFRAYYRVEMPAAEAPPVPEQPVVAEPFAAEPVLAEPLLAEPAAAEPVAVAPDEPVEALAVDPAASELLEPEVAANGKRSLGFFAH